METHTSSARHVLRTAGTTIAICLFAVACRDDTPPSGPPSSGTTSAREVSGHSVHTVAAARDHQYGADDFTKDFALERCTFASTGKNAYFNLTPGNVLRLSGQDGDESVVLRITVLNQTKQFGNVRARVIEERESKNGELVEVSRNYYAMCTQNNSVFYFGEDVDFYEDGRIVSHEGSWRHGVNGARAGLIMPGLPLLGARYYQEVAPGVALDRAMITSVNATVRIPAGRFTGVLTIEETTQFEPGVTGHKNYAPGIGLIRDGVLSLVRAGSSDAEND